MPLGRMQKLSPQRVQRFEEFLTEALRHVQGSDVLESLDSPIISEPRLSALLDEVLFCASVQHEGAGPILWTVGPVEQVCCVSPERLARSELGLAGFARDNEREIVARALAEAYDGQAVRLEMSFAYERETCRAVRVELFPVLRPGTKETVRLLGRMVAIDDESDVRAGRQPSGMSVIEQQMVHTQKLEAIGTLASGIAHDFNNVLYALSGFVDLAAEEVGEGHSAYRFLELAHSSVERATNLVKQILTFSRQGGQKRSQLTLQPIIKESLKFFRGTLPTWVLTHSSTSPR
jgi:signal transduction histidine kinase